MYTILFIDPFDILQEMAESISPPRALTNNPRNRSGTHISCIIQLKQLLSTYMDLFAEKNLEIRIIVTQCIWRTKSIKNQQLKLGSQNTW